MRTQTRTEHFGPEALVLCTVALLTLLVWPVGDYGVDDDWAFTWSLAHLVENGRIEILDWNPMTLVGHLAWGWIFTAPFGFDSAAGPTLAKLSTVVLLALETLALLAVLRQVGVDGRTRTVAALALLASPVHFFQSFLYATDVPALAWSMLAFLAYTRGLQEPGKPRYRLLVLASLCGAMGFALRQSALIVVGAVGLYLLIFERKRLGDPWVWVSCFGAPCVALVAIQSWYHFAHGPTSAYTRSLAQILDGLWQLGPGRVAYLGAALLSYLALPLLPICGALSAQALSTLWQRPRRLFLVASAGGVLGLFGWTALYRDRLFPFIHNKLTRFGFLSPGEVIVGARDPIWGESAAIALTLALAIVAVLALWRIAPPREPSGDEGDGATTRARAVTRRMSLLWLALLIGYGFSSAPIAFDRHYIVFAPVVLCAWFASAPVLPMSWLRAAAILLALFTYDTIATQEVHAFSRAAAAIANRLVSEGVPVHEIEAGYAWDGLHMYAASRPSATRPEPTLRARGGARPVGADPWYVRALTPGIRTRYVVSLSKSNEQDRYRNDLPYWAHRFTQPDLRQYRVQEEHSYARIWPLSPGRIYLLLDQRSDAGSAK